MDTEQFLNSTKEIDRSNDNLYQKSLKAFLKNSSSVRLDTSKKKALANALYYLEKNYDRTTNIEYSNRETIQNFLKSSKINIVKNDENVVKSVLKSNIKETNPFGHINLTDLLYHSIGSNLIDKNDLEDILTDTEFLNKNGIDKSLYELLLKSVKETKGDVINGLDAFITQSRVLEKTELQEIKVDLDIVRTNFTIDIEDFETIRDALPTANYILLKMKSGKVKREQLNRVSSYISRMSGVKTILRAENIKKASIDDEELPYHIPDWANAKERSGMNMNVRQTNMLVRNHTHSSEGMAPFYNSNNFTRGLIDFLSPSTDQSWEGDKEGFHTYGASPNRIAEIRPAINKKTGDNYDISEITSYYKTIENDNLRTFDEDGYVHYIVNRGAQPLFLKMLELGGLKVPPAIVSTKTLNNIGVRRNVEVKKAFLHSVYNMSIKALMNRAPDFRQNMYLGLFVMTDSSSAQITDSFYDMVNNLETLYKDDDAVKLNRTTQDKELAKAYESFKNIVDTYYVRMEGITVPGASVDSYEIPYLTRKIKKVHSNFMESHKATINFTLDETGSLLRHFDLLTGTFSQQVDQEEHNLYSRNFFPISFNHNNTSKLDLVITYNDFRMSDNTRQGEFTRSNYFPAQQDVVSGEVFITNQDDTKYIGDRDAYRKFIFEDVRILGFSNGLQFQRDSANRMSISVDIMFKRITTIDNNIPYSKNI